MWLFFTKEEDARDRIPPRRRQPVSARTGLPVEEGSIPEFHFRPVNWCLVEYGLDDAPYHGPIATDEPDFIGLVPFHVTVDESSASRPKRHIGR